MLQDWDPQYNSVFLLCVGHDCKEYSLKKQSPIFLQEWWSTFQKDHCGFCSWQHVGLWRSESLVYLRLGEGRLDSHFQITTYHKRLLLKLQWPAVTPTVLLLEFWHGSLQKPWESLQKWASVDNASLLYSFHQRGKMNPLLTMILNISRFYFF